MRKKSDSLCLFPHPCDTTHWGFDTLELLLNLLRCDRCEVLFFVLAFVLFDHLLELLTLSLSFAKADRC